MKKYILTILIVCTAILSQGKGVPEDGVVVRLKVIDGDTVLYEDIREVVVFPKRTFKNKRDYKKYRRLVRDVKKTLPYAKLAVEILEELNAEYLLLENDAERKKYTKELEKELRKEFESELKKLTIRQGRLLIKLIDRETGKTSFELVKELRGGFSAFFWQSLAKLFGSDLKTNYDPLGKDRLIEEIVIQVENGQL